ncbi:MAG TPA: LptF/LptG family permease [Kiritimatiellia bacterium]|nr:LptF/LptG family permease [Kiritimatiellia bacterium]
MKLIDKYLLKTFLVPLLYCFATFSLVFIIFDLFSTLDDFLDGKTPLLLVVRYYLTLMPSLVVFVVPISLLLAVLYSLSTLTKNHELTAMRACGISLIRLMMPFIMVGFFASLGVLAINETVAPEAAYWCKKFVSEQSKSDPDSVHVAELAFYRERGNRYWFIGQFDTRDFSMRNIVINQMREDNSEEFKLQAESGRWVEGHWFFTDVAIQNYDREGNPRGAPRFNSAQEMFELNERPMDFLAEVKPPEFMSSRELLRYLRGNRQLQGDARTRKVVDLHHRLAQPWMCLVVTLLGIPFGNQTGRKGALTGFMLSIGMFFGYYALMNVGLYLGKEEYLLPWLSGWIPNIVFFVTGTVMIYRMR